MAARKKTAKKAARKAPKKAARKASKKAAKKAARKAPRASAKKAPKRKGARPANPATTRAKTTTKAAPKKAAPKPAKADVKSVPKTSAVVHVPASLVGKPAPEFTMPTGDGQTISLSDFRGKRVLLYFYPKDDTPGCTAQACALRDGMEDLSSANTIVIGVSKDSVASHQKFKTKYDLNFLLASDENTGVSEKYGVWTEKSMYGRKYMGIERSTFLIDENGIVRQEWRKVSVPTHYDDVKQALGALG